MGRTPPPPLGRFSRQVIEHTLDLLALTAHDASGRWLAAQIDMSHNYVAKRLRSELPFTTTDVERIASAFGLSTVAFVEAAASRRTGGNVTELRPRVPAHEQDDLAAVARTTDPEPTDEQ